MTDYPITPPPELVQQWWATETYDPFGVALLNLATKAAQWGADQELKACCALMDDWGLDEADLRAARRALLAQPEPYPPADGEMAPHWSEGICGDGAAILRDGVMIPIEEVIAELNRRPAPQPEPVAPTDEEIMELMPQQMRDDLAAAARALAGFDNPQVMAVFRIILNRHAVDHARAALAKWDHQ